MIVPTSAVLSPASTGAGSYGLPALMAVQAVSGAYSQYQQGKARKYASRANERVAEMQAKDALARGREAEAVSRQKGRKVRGSQRAAMAAQGIRTDFGSALDIQQETEDIGELDALNIRLSAAREAFGYQSQARGFAAEGNQAMRAGTIGGLDTLLSGGIKAYDAYKRTR